MIYLTALTYELQELLYKNLNRHTHQAQIHPKTFVHDQQKTQSSPIKATIFFHGCP